MKDKIIAKQQETTAIEQIREAFEPLQQGSKEGTELHPVDLEQISLKHSSKHDFTMTDKIEEPIEKQMIGFDVLKRNREIEMEQSIKAVRKKEQTMEEIKHKFIAASFEFEDSDGIKHSPCIALEDAINSLQEYAQQSKREIIEDWMEWYYESEIDDYTKKHIKKYLKLKI